MPHRRRRHIEPILSKLLKLSPIVGILGHRQVGKTTLLELTTKKYFTLDDSTQLLSANTDPKSYIQERAGLHVGIDECQLAPPLFPALKEWVRTHPQRGQFLLTGSVRFTSKKAIQESLTGRIINLELLPLLISELKSEALPNFWRKLVLTNEFDDSFPWKQISNRHHQSIVNYFELGGLPGICFIREKGFRERKLDSQLETILDRDLRKVVPTNIPYPQIRRLLQALGDRQGSLFSWTDLSAMTDISTPTIKKLVYGLEAVFLLRTLLVEGDAKGPVYYFEDVGELAFLRSKPQTLVEKIVHFLSVHIRGEMSYGTTEPYRLFQYRTRSGVLAPLVLQVKQAFLGIIVTESDKPSRIELAAGDSLLKRYNQSKVVFIHAGTTVHKLSDRKMVIPIAITV